MTPGSGQAGEDAAAIAAGPAVPCNHHPAIEMGDKAGKSSRVAAMMEAIRRADC